MTPAELADMHSRLESFAHGLFQPLNRRDQRAQGLCYLRGLLLEGTRKSVQQMAAQLPEGNAQALHHFLNDSPWSSRQVQQRLARQVCQVIRPQAWVINAIDFPKSGLASVGVHRHYSHRLAKVVNSQVGVTVHAVTKAAGCPINWRLYLPEAWDHDDIRRAAAHVPDTVRHRPTWQLALDMLDELVRWRLSPPIVLVEARHGTVCDLIQGLEGRGLSYLVRVAGKTRPPGATEGTAVLDRRRLLWPHRHEWAHESVQPDDHWFSNLPHQAEPSRLALLAGLLGRAAQEDRKLRTTLGLDHFEGRSFRGWHHHVTLVSAAHAFLTLERMRVPSWQTMGN